MATYYARNVTGNWASTTSWDTASSGGTGPAGPPVAGDTAIFDASFTGSITVAASAACATLTCESGAAGTLTISSAITVSGDITFVSTMTLAGTSVLTQGAAGTLTGGGISGSNFTGELRLTTGNKNINTNGTTWALVGISGSMTMTLQSAFQANTLYVSSNNPVFAGAYNITVGTFKLIGPTTATQQSLTLVSGQRLQISTAMLVVGTPYGGGSTIKASTESSPAYIEYTGADASTIECFATHFTDIDFSTYSTPVTGLDNWYGGTLTRTVGITNRTSADIMVTYYVDADAAGGGDGSVGTPYDSLSACEAARNTNNGQGGSSGTYTHAVRYLCSTSSGGADTVNTYVNGGTQTAANYLLIQAADGHRASAKWNSSKYRIELTSAESMFCIAINDDYVRLDGLQGRLVSVTDSYCTCFGVDYTITATSNRVDITNCLAICPDDTTYPVNAFGVGDDDTNASLVNCVAWVPYSTSYGFFGFMTNGLTSIYNCTAQGGQYGFRANSGSHTIYMKNCVAVGGYGGFVLNVSAYGLDKVNCASGDTSASATGTGITATNCIDNVPNTTATFVDPTNATITSRDWHLAGPDSDLYGAGVAPGGSDPLDYTTDIDGDTIGAGGRYDIGADWYQSEVIGPIAWGEQNPDETAMSWSDWLLTGGGAVTVQGDADWGRMEVSDGTPCESSVVDMGDALLKAISALRDKYETGGGGTGVVTIYVRGSATSFARTDGSPSWAEYTAAIDREWRYVQWKLEYVSS